MSNWHYIWDIWPSKPSFLPEDYPDLTGKTALITGTSSGIGKETTRLLLAQNATVILVNRNKDKTLSAIADIKKSLIQEKSEFNDTMDSRIIPIYADLSDLTTLKAAGEQIKSRVDQLDLVILNAGVMLPPNGSFTKQGYELQIGTNVIGHQLLLKLINPLILKAISDTSTPRVLFLSSAAHLSAPKDGVDFERGFKDACNAASLRAYAQSKAGNIYQAYIYGQDNPQVVSLAVHPGYLGSDLARDLPIGAGWLYKLFLYGPIYGSYTELFAALNPDITTKDSGRFVAPWGQFRDVRADIQAGFMNGKARMLWDAVEQEIRSFV